MSELVNKQTKLRRASRRARGLPQYHHHYETPHAGKNSRFSHSYRYWQCRRDSFSAMYSSYHVFSSARRLRLWKTWASQPGLAYRRTCKGKRLNTSHSHVEECSSGAPRASCAAGADMILSDANVHILLEHVTCHGFGTVTFRGQSSGESTDFSIRTRTFVATIAARAVLELRQRARPMDVTTAQFRVDI